MLIAIFFIFLVCVSFSFFEENLRKRDKLLLLLFVGVIMILIAGTRGVLDTPDSDNYETQFNEVSSLDASDSLQEPSFTFISYYVNLFGLGINGLFFIYALLSIPLRIGAIWKLSKLPILTLSIYISFYYQLHDLVQIRCAVASAMFMFAVYYKIEKQKWKALAFILVGAFFHYSAIAGLLIFLFNNKKLETRHIVMLLGVLFFGVAFYFSGLDFSVFLPDELGGRLQIYRELKENGIEGDLEGVAFYKNPMVLTNIALYLFCIYYHKILTESYEYLPFMLKLMGVAFIFLLTMGNISSVVSSRLFEYFDVVSIFLWTALIYAFKPVSAGKVIVHVISTARIIYSVLIYTLHL